MPFLFGKNIALDRNKIFKILFVFVFVFFFLFFFSSSRAFAASRYWVGGTGNWDTTDTTHWSATSGGAGGATVPGSSIDVVFDENSGSGTATITGGTVFAKTITQTNGAGTLNVSILQSNTLNLYGNVVLLPGKFSVSASNYQFRYFNSGTIISGGNTLGEFLVQGASVAVVLGDALIASKVTLTSGTLTTGAFTHNWGILSSSNSNTRVFNGTGSTVNITGTTGTVWDFTTSTGLTFTAPTTISLSSAIATRSFNAGGNAFNNVSVASSSFPSQFTGDITVNGIFTISSPNIIKITGGKTITMGPSSGMVWNGSVGNLIDINVVSGTTPWIISRPSGTQTFNANYLNLGYSTATQANTFFTSNTTNTGTNTNWVFANAPDAPTGLTGTYGDAQASLLWTLGADNGASITDYVIEYKLTSEPTTWSIFADAVSTLTTATVTGLTNGLSYDFRVYAVNAIGQGSASATTTLFIGSVKYARTVGGNWSSDATWSTTSGGSADTTAPTATDYVIFDTNSGNVTVDTTTAVAKNLNMTGSAGTLTITNAMKLSVSGSVILASGKFTAGGDTAEIAMLATGTLTTAGNTLGAVRFNGSGQTFTMGDGMTTRASAVVYMDAGTLITGVYTHYWGQLNANSNNTRIVNISGSTMNFLNPGGSNIWSFQSGTNTVITDANTIIDAYSATTTVGFWGVSGQAYNGIVRVSGTGGLQISTVNTFHNLTIDGSSQTAVSKTLILNANINIDSTGTLTLKGGADNRYRLLVSSNSLGTPRTLTVNGSTNFTNADFRDITIAGSVAPVDYSTAEIGNAGGNSGINFRAGENRYYHVGTGNFHDAKWYSATNGGGVAKGMPLPQDTAVFDANSFDGTSILTIANPRIGSIDMSAVDDAVTLSLSNIIEVYGDYILGTNITSSGSYAVSLYGKLGLVNNFNTYGKTCFRFYFYRYTYLNLSNLIATSNVGIYPLATFDLNDYDLTTGGLASYNGTGVIYLGNGIVTLTYNSTYPIMINGVFYAEGSTIIFKPASGTSIVSIPYSHIYNIVKFSNGGTFAGTFDVLGSNTFSQMIIDPGLKVRFTAGTTQNIGSMTAIGTADSPITITSVTNAIHTLRATTGTIIGNYLNLSYSTATGGASFYATNSTNGGNNSGWIFANAPDAPTAVSAVGGNAEVSLSWTAGADNGTAITDYIVEYKLSTEPTTWSIFSDGVSALTTATVTGLTNGLSYDFRVSAVNAIGQGTASATATSTSINPLDRYWVGGAGNWSDTAHWSNTSNGVGGQTVPTSTNDVYFDASSGAGTATIDTTTAVAKSVNMTGSTTTLTITNAMKLSVSGSVTLASGKFTAGGDTANLTMLATGTLISNGNTLGAITFNGSEQTFTFGDAIVNQRRNSAVTLIEGTLNAGAYSHSWGYFTSSNSNTRTLNLSGSTINILSDSGTIWNVSTGSSSYTFITDSSTIINFLTMDGNGGLYFGGKTINGTVNISGVGTTFIGGISNTFHNLSFDGSAKTSKTMVLSLGENQTIDSTGTLTLKGGADNRYRLLVQSNTLGTRRTITLNSGATTSMQRVDFRDIGFTDPIDLSGITGGAGDALGNNNIIFNPSRNMYWKTTGGGNLWWEQTNWYSQTNGGGTRYTDSPLPQDNVFFDANSISGGATTIGLDYLRPGANIDFTGSTNILTLTPNVSWTTYGNLTFSSSMIFTAGSYSTTFEGRGNHTFTSGGKIFSTIYFQGEGGTYTLQDNLNNGALFISAGTLTATTQNVSSAYILFSLIGSSRTINAGSGTWSFSQGGGGAALNFLYTNSTFNAQTSTFEFTQSRSSQEGGIYLSAGMAFNNLKITGVASGTATWRLLSTIINGTFTITAPNRIVVDANASLIMGPSSSIVAVGSSGNFIFFDTRYGTGTWTISRPSGTQNFLLGWLNLNRSVATQANTFFASNTTNTGTNTNWVFANAPDAPTAVSAVGGNAEVSLSWSAPAWNGGTAITDYIIEYKLSSEPTTWSTFSDGVSAGTTGTVTGLLNGSSYDFRISAVNFIGQGVASSVAMATPITVPDAPTNAVAVRGNTTASVSFSAPLFDGGSPITNYTVTSSPGNFSGNGNASPIVVSGLTNGTAYTFTVTATNSAGTGPASQASSPVTPATIPDAPTLPIAVAGNAQVSLSWTAPINNGGSDVTDYVIEYKLSSSGTWSTFADGVSANTNGIVTGLTNALSYDFRISAVNDVGQGSASANTNATPVTVPDAPTAVSAVAGNAQATVSFTPPAFNGGSTINNYTVTSSPGNISNTGNASPILITGLTNGTQYTFTVTATNAVGESLPSSASTPVTPITVPDAPTNVTAVPGNTQVIVSFVAPIFNGGTPITSYTATSSPGNFTGTGNASPIVVTGLTNGATYTFTVTATNIVGRSAPSSPSNNVTLYTEPGAPVNLAATVLGSSVGLSWSAPILNGGSAVTDYVIEYQLTTGGVWAVFADGINVNTTATILGLSNGTLYDFRVKAVNIIGESLPSSSVSASPGEPAQVLIQNFSNLSVPNIGTNIRITNEGAIAYEYQYTWCVTDSDVNLCGGGDDVFSSTAAKLINSGENFDTTLISTVLAPGNYYFHIKVLYGSSSSRADQSFTALATFPDAPTDPVAVAGNAQATVSFTTPAFDGGSPITGYTVVSNGGGITSTGNASPIVVTGLTNGLFYIFTVTATNAIGTSSPSISSNSIIPMTVPDAPTGVVAVAGNKQVSLSWLAGNDGGSSIIDYVIEYKLATESVWLIFADSISTETNVIVTGLTNNLTYDFRISAVNIMGQSNVNGTNTTLPADINTGGGGGGHGGYLKPKPIDILNKTPIDNIIQEVSQDVAEVPDKKVDVVNNNKKDNGILPSVDKNISEEIILKESEIENTVNNTNKVKAVPLENPVELNVSLVKDNKIIKIILYIIGILGTGVILGGGTMLFIRRRNNFKIEEFGGKEENENISKIPKNKIKRKI